MPVVRTRSKRVKESSTPEKAGLESGDAKNARPTRKKKESSEHSTAEVDARENARTPVGKRQAAKRKQEQDEPELDYNENESKKRRITRKSNVIGDEKRSERAGLKNSRARKSNVEEKSVSPAPEPKGRRSKAPGPKPAAEAKKPSPPEKPGEVISNGRPSRNARKSSVVLVDFDPDEESETDFSDNDDDDFVLPESEKSDDDEGLPEGDPEPEESVAPRKAAPKKVASTRAKSQLSRSDKIREFLLDVDSSAPAGVCLKSEPRVPPKKVEKPEARKKVEKPEAPKAVEVTPKASRVRPSSVARSTNASDESDSEDEDEVPVAKSRAKQSRSAKATPSSKDKKKRARGSSGDSEDSLIAPKKKKAVRTPKVSMKNRKTFMKPKKIAVKKAEDEISEDGIETSLFEKSLLKLAKRMDDKDGSENSESEENDDAKESKEGDEEKAEDELAKEEASKAEAEAAAKTEAEKKLLILSMLKEHEPVDDMSDGSSEDDDNADSKVESDEKKAEKSEGSNAIKSEPEEVEKNPAAESKSGRKKSKKAKGESGTETVNSPKKSPAKKGAVKKEEAIKTEKAADSSDSEDENWEVVENAAVRDPNYKRPDNVTVVLHAEDFIADGKNCLSMEQRMVRLINRRRRGVALYSHRVHLLTLIAYHRWLNSIIESDHVRAYALSILPANLAMPGKSRNEPKMIQQLLSFYESNFELLPSNDAFIPRKLRGELLKLLAHKKTYCNITYLFGLITLLRVCGIRSRLCLSYRLSSHRAVQLRIKDGEMIEVGAKTRTAATGTGIDDYFVEVYFSNKKRWRPIDIENFNVIEDPEDLMPHLEQPVSHLIGIDGKGCMVDLSPKYNADWLNRVKILRGDPKFIEEVLQRYAPEEKEQIEEKKEVKSKHDQQGLPKVISEYKNHPKYALRRHLLKHEAFYPREPPVLGEIRGEPVYPRENVYTLHSKDQWYRKARSVREGEEPYNVVTARPKFDRRKEVWVKDLPMEIFGEWQTERFKPPVVVDGKIPRNKYGNVDLFHPDMLPIGAAHVKLPMLNKVAADLGVDCVPAVIGFDGLGRAFHAVIEGYIVCEEHKEMLEKAWEERQHEDRHTRRERIRQRAIRNWKMMIKKVIWDLRLKKKYKNNLEQE